MASELFLQMDGHFVKYSYYSPNKRTLMLLDGHASYKNLKAVEYEKQQEVLVRCQHITTKQYLSD